MTARVATPLPLWFRGLVAVGALLALIAAGLLVWQIGLPAEDDEAVGPVRSFAAQTLSGETLTIDQQTARPVILNFWATWCGPCVVEMPRLEAAYQTHRTRGLLVIGINAGQEDPRDAAAFALSHDLSFPIVMDNNRRLEQLYEVRGALPTTVFIDADGNIQTIVYGVLSEDALSEGLRRIGLPG